MFKSPFLASTFLRSTFSLPFFIAPLAAQDLSSAFSVEQTSPLVDSQAKSEIQKQHIEAQEAAKKQLIPEAIATLTETKKAVEFLKNGQDEQALAAIEQATKKINALLEQHSKNAVLPVDVAVNLVDTAPASLAIIKDVDKAIEEAVKDRNYPDSRLLLDMLRSEINIFFYSLPLDLYPEALKEAAKLIRDKKNKEAIGVLETALHTLNILNQTIPIPVLKTLFLLTVAEGRLEQEHNKDVVLMIINKAHDQLERAKELGYINPKDDEYEVLKDTIKDLKETVSEEGKEKSHSIFEKLKMKLSDFLKRLAGPKKANLDPTQTA